MAANDLAKQKEEAKRQIALMKQKEAAKKEIAALKAQSAGPAEPGMMEQAGEAALSGLQFVGTQLDRFGAPVRATIGKAQEGKYSEIPGAAGEAFLEPGSAPTGKELVAREGLSKEETIPVPFTDVKLSPAGVAGFAADIALDPLTYIPGGAFVKGAERAAKVAKVPAKALKQGASFLTGVAVKDIENYAKNADKITKFIAKHDRNIDSMADETRNLINAQVQRSRQGLSQQITNALENSENAGVKSIDANDLVKKLETEKAKLNKTTKEYDRKLIDDEIDTIIELSDDSGKISMRDLYEVTQSLQEGFKRQKPDQFFSVKGTGDRGRAALRKVSRDARIQLNKIAPEIKDANEKLAQLHRIENRMQRTLLQEGKPAGTLVAAGRNANRNTKVLQDLSKITGTDLVQPVEMLSTAETFATRAVPELDPKSIASRGSIRQVAATAGGFGLGGAPGAALGFAMTSPVALKAALDASQISKRAVSKIMGLPGVKQLDMMIKNKPEAVWQHFQNNPEQFKGLIQINRQFLREDEQEKKAADDLQSRVMQQEINTFPQNTPQRRVDSLIGSTRAANLAFSAAAAKAQEMTTPEMLEYIRSNKMDNADIGIKDYFSAIATIGGTGGDVLNPASEKVTSSILFDATNRFTPHNAQKLVAEMAKMQGIPTMEKIEEMDLPAAMRQELKGSLAKTLKGVAESATVKVTDPMAQNELIKYWKNYQDPVDRAKNISEMNETGEVDSTEFMSYVQKDYRPPVENPFVKVMQAMEA